MFARKLIRPFSGRPDQASIASEIRAIETLCNGSHQNVIKVFCHGLLRPGRSVYFIDMEMCDANLEEFVAGQTQFQELINWPKASKSLRIRYALNDVMKQILEGLIFIHSHDEVHRDLSPQNCIAFICVCLTAVLYSVNDGAWKIADFSLMSKGTTGGAVPTEFGRGKSGYRAPELLSESNSWYNKKADIWSLGCIIYELCVGRKAFHNDNATLQFRSANSLVPITVSDVDTNVCEIFHNIIGDMLNPNPEYRPSSTTLRNELNVALVRLNSSLDSITDSNQSSTLIIGIDFGTTFTGVAYARRMGAERDEVNIIRSWPNQRGFYLEKTPTILSYNTTPPSWGASVRPEDKPQIAYFKLGLQCHIVREWAVEFDRGYLVNPYWRHPSLPDMLAVDYTADYLARIVEYVRNEFLPKLFGSDFLNSQRISYVIGVPPIWSDGAKDLTVTAAERAGIPRKDLSLISETEAAALYCSIACRDELDNFYVGSRFLICDAGGGTVVCHLP